MAAQPQSNEAADDRDNERAPLLRHTNKPQAHAIPESGRDDAADTAADGSLSQLMNEARSLRHRRWISLIASILLIAAFIVILILSGGTCLNILVMCLVSFEGALCVAILDPEVSNQIAVSI